MIRLSDAFTLSVTKLKTRRVRLVVTTVVSGLFFVVLAFASSVFNGTIKSVEEFSADGFGSRYITRVDGISGPDDYSMYENKDLIAQAKVIDADLIARKKAAAKELGLTYEPTLEQASVVPTGPNGTEGLNDTPQIQELLRGAKIEQSKGFFASLDKAQKEYDVIARYQSISLGNTGMYGPVTNLPTMVVIKDNKEKTASDSNQYQYGLTGIASLPVGLTLMNDPVLDAFLLPEQSFVVGDNGSLPIIAPYTAAEEILGLGKLPSSASSKVRLDRLKEVRSQVSGKTVEVCLRNQASLERQQLAEQQQLELETNKNKKGYIRPELIYEKSAKPCQDVVVQRDVRSAYTKKETAKQEEFDRRFGKQDASQRIVTFKIVGVVSDPPNFGGFSVKSLISSLLTSNLGSGWFVPFSAKDSLPEYSSLYADADKITNFNNGVYFELASPEEAKRFAKEKTCNFDFFSGEDPSKLCIEKGTPFYLTSFGSNSVALNDAKTGFQNFYFKAALVIALISAIIMMGTVGKVIADSRRETAVFRAIGAKRIDIAQIYILYSLMLGVIVAVFSVGAGYFLASILNARSADGLTIDALIAYNSSNLDRTFSIVGFNSKELLGLVGIIILAGLVSAVGPLISNLKRNPIRDMRDER